MLSQQQTLDQLLLAQLSQPSLQNYALALNAARHSTVSTQTLEMLKVLNSREGDKWLEVVNRLSERYLEVVFERYGKEVEMYRGFVGNLTKYSDWQALVAMLMKQIQSPQLNISPRLIFQTSYMLLHRLQQFQILPPQFSSQTFINFLAANASLMDTHFLQCVYFILRGQQKNDMSQRTHIKLFLFSLLDHLVKIQMTCESLRVFTVACRSFLASDWFSLHAVTLAVILEQQLKEFTKGLEKEGEIEEVINYQEDVSRGKESMTIYTLAAHLLQVLAEDVDGLLPTLMRKYLKNIRFILSSRSRRPIVEPSPQEQSTTLQLSFLSLNILSPQLSNRSDLLDQIVSFIEQSHKSIFTLTPQSISNLRTIRFIGSFSNCLFSTQLQSALTHLLTIIKNTPLSLQGQQSCQTLLLLIDSDQLYSRLESCVYELSASIYTIMEKSPSEKFFEFLAVFIKRFGLFVEKYCVSVVGRLVERVGVGVQNRGCQLAMRCFDCLESVLNCKDVVKDLYQSFDKHLEKLCVLLRNPQLAEIFEGKIFLLAGILITDTNEITDFTQGCVTAVEIIYQRTQCISDLTELIYACCVYAKHNILLKHRSVIEIFNRTLMAFLRKPNNEEEFIKGCYLTQLFLQSFKEYFQEKPEQHQRNYIILQQLIKEPPIQRCKIACHGVLISLASIRVFNLPRLSTFISQFSYDNKMYLIYYSIILRQNFNTELFSEFLGYCRAYIASLSGEKMESEEISRDYLEEWIGSLQLPNKNIDQWKILQHALKELRERGFLTNQLNLTQNQLQTLRDIQQMSRCQGGGARKIVRVI